MQPADEAPRAMAARASWARFIKKVFAADPLVCPDCDGAMRIIAFIEEPQLVRAILEHLSLWDEPRPPPAPPAAPFVPLALEYLPWVECSVPGVGAVVCRDAGYVAVPLAFGGSSWGQDPTEP